jgi:hypothetical protein
MPNWYKGNIHTHTTKSDGDADPEVVVKWFMEHDYDFLVLSDHNHRTILEHEVEGGPLMIPGEEVSARIQTGSIPIHINGIGISRVVEPYHGDEIVDTIQRNVNAILDAGGIASINHPNYQWAFDHTHVRQVDGASLMEVFNGSPVTNNEGGPGKFTAEEIWDGVLSAGKVIFGTATDDSHRYYDYHPGMSNPGRGWVVVRATELTVNAIVDGLAMGEFYSSTGIVLEELEQSDESVSLTIKEESDFIFTTTFSGKDGKVLAEETGLSVSYSIKGDEGYVRATVRSSSGGKAWTQPVFIKGD